MSGGETNFNVTPSQAPFMREIAREMVKQDDYRGMGGHGLETHGPHGPHTQISIGLGNQTINIRESK
jgi:hypothetical protein